MDRSFHPCLSYAAALCFLILVVTKGSAQIQTAGDQIDEIFKEWNTEGSPGASVAVVQNGDIVFKKGYGLANLEYNIANGPNTVFHIASVSKQFTVFAILLLEADGKLSLDDDIRKFIPEVPDFGSTITLRHLATHTSGLRDQWNLLAMAGWQLDDVITKDHVLKLVKRQQALNFQPGDQYIYCNTGFTLLAEVVARVAKQSFAYFTQERIFKPLAMSATLFYDDHERIVKNRAYSYYKSGTGFKKRVLSYANVGATSLFTTVEDLALWVNNFSELKVGTHEMIEQMDRQTKLSDGEVISGAMGQFVNEYQGHRQIQHGGADAGYRSYLGRFPDQGLSVIVLGNSAQFNASGVALKIADLFLPKSDTIPSDQYSAPPSRESISISKSKLKTYAGSYWNEKSKYMRKIYLNNDTLRYDRGNGFISPLLPLGDGQFQMLRVTSDLKVSFLEKDQKKLMQVSIDGAEPIVSYAFKPMDQTLATMQHYAGKYRSEELATEYEFHAQSRNLRVSHSRLPDFQLKPQKTDIFTGNRWYFSLVEFQRDEQGEITGVLVSSDRVKNLWFKKINR